MNSQWKNIVFTTSQMGLEVIILNGMNQAQKISSSCFHPDVESIKTDFRDVESRKVIDQCLGKQLGEKDGEGLADEYQIVVREEK